MNNSGTLVIAPIRPQDSADTYPVAYSNEIAGGWHQVDSLSARNAISDERRVEGMVCYVIDQSAYYVLKGGITNADWQTTSSSAITGRLGIPTDGQYGANGNTVSGILSGDLIEDAFDKVETILEKLAPTKPVNLANIQLAVVNGYSAKETATGTLRTTVIDSTTPTVQTPQLTSQGFFDATQGVLAAFIDSSLVGTRTLAVSSDVGTYGALQITFDDDYYQGVSGKQNFWYALGAKIVPTVPLSVGVHHFQLTHSITGSSLLDVYVDDLLTPIVSGLTITPSGSPRWISGVPSMQAGQTINVAASVAQAVRTFYNATQLATIGSSVISTVSVPPPTTPSNGMVASINSNTIVLNNVYVETPTFTVTGYNSKGTTGSGAVARNIRVDTISDESTRVISGVGQFPVIGTFGNSFVTTAQLSANEELQMRGGLLMYPRGDYRLNLPTPGPNYSSLAGGTYNGFRWVTFRFTVTNVSSVTITLQNASNFSSVLQSNFALYARVAGGSSNTNGWVDGNAAYPGVGDPTNNGDAALDYSNSTATVKRITFGTTVRSGTLFVRIGLNATPQSFSGITVS